MATKLKVVEQLAPDLPPPAPPLAFDPAPTCKRHNGWTPDRQRDFILALARGASVKLAAANLGMSRQSAYQLRGRPGAESFAAAWDAALDLAYRARTAGSRTSGLPPIFDTMFVPRYYGGRLIGFVQRPDDRRLYADLVKLDKMIARAAAEPPGPSAAPSQACHD